MISLISTLLLALPQCQPHEATLFAGQTTDIGSISVSNTSEQLVVRLDVPSPWFFKTMHLYAGTGPVPTNRGGNVAPGQFPYKEDFDGRQHEWSFVVDLADLGVVCGDTINLAVHLEAFMHVSGGSCKEETAWAFGPDEFTGGQWGWSLPYTLCCDGCGTRADLALDSDPLFVGIPSTVTVTGADPQEFIYLAVNCGTFACDAGIAPPILGGLALDLTGRTVLGDTATADASGVATLSVTVPPNFAARIDRLIGLQAAAVRGLAGVDSLKSNPRLLRIEG